MNSAERLVKQIEKALRLGGDVASVSDVMAAIKAGHAQVLTRNRSMIVTEIRETSRGKHMHIWLVAGDMEDCVELQRTVCDAARDFGCTKATFHGRPGWNRHPATENEGWKPLYTGFIKELVP